MSGAKYLIKRLVVKAEVICRSHPDHRILNVIIENRLITTYRPNLNHSLKIKPTQLYSARLHKQSTFRKAPPSFDRCET